MHTLPSDNFVIVGQQPWDTPIGSNCKNIAEELSKKYKVLYINIPLDRITVMRKAEADAHHIKNRMDVRQGKKEALENINPNLWVFTPSVIIESINFLPDGFMFDWLNKRNNRMMAKEIKKALRTMDFGKFILFNDSDMFRSLYLKEMLEPVCSVYYSRDNLISTEYFAKHGPRLEAQLIAKSDLATANSIYLKNYCAQFNPQSFYVGQGCELDLFDPEKIQGKPKDLTGIEDPIIGYIGALLKMRLDLKLLEQLAERKPEWQFVYVGPEDEHFAKSNLHARNNVHFLGPKKPAELPQYLHYFDVAINPQELNPMTIGNYPRKIDEYLAMGKPTVATRTEAMQAFEGYVHLADDLETYITALQKAIDEKEDQDLAKKRRAFAMGHSWENSVNEILKGIEIVFANR